MVEDSTLVALIRESVEASERSRRVAARILLEVLSHGDDLDVPKLERIEGEAALAVADEIRTLAKQYRLLA